MSSSISNSSSAATPGGGDGRRRGSRRRSAASANCGGGEGRQIPPVDAFVAMEDQSAIDLCEIVSASLGSVKKVRQIKLHSGKEQDDIYFYCGTSATQIPGMPQ